MTRYSCKFAGAMYMDEDGKYLLLEERDTSKIRMKSRYCQIQNPISKQWKRIDRKTGLIVGSRNKPYKCPTCIKTKRADKCQ